MRLRGGMQHIIKLLPCGVVGIFGATRLGVFGVNKIHEDGYVVLKRNIFYDSILYNTGNICKYVRPIEPTGNICKYVRPIEPTIENIDRSEEMVKKDTVLFPVLTSKEECLIALWNATLHLVF